MDNWLTKVLGVAAGSVLAGWIHRVLNRPGHAPVARAPERPVRLDVSLSPAAQPSRASALRLEIEAEQAALQRAVDAWRNSRWREALFFPLLFGSVGLYIALVTVIGTGEGMPPVGGTLLFAFLMAVCAHLFRQVGTREVRRIKQRILGLRRLLDEEMGLPRTPEQPG